MGFDPSRPKGRRRTGQPATRHRLMPGRNGGRGIALLALAILAAVLARWVPQPVEGSIEGRPRLVDGDSFFIGATEVRMQGIDAPEGRQACMRNGEEWRCGEAAKTTLQRLTGGQSIRCDIHSTDQHGRRLATCFAASGKNLNARMVADGYAVAFGAYRTEEAAAKANRRGLWASEFEQPQDWRRRNGAR
jgi:endonuclease YncB( thermonuclease family)